MVPLEGLEPPLLSEADFESAASTIPPQGPRLRPPVVREALRRQPERGLTANMIRITDSIVIDPADVQESFIRSSGPGGQNVNKVSTAVEIRFNVSQAALPDLLKARLKTLAGRQLTLDGVLVITAQVHRSQERNRAEAMGKLVALLRKAAHRPKRRLATRPTKASKVRRLEAKTRRSNIKSLRKSNPRHED